MESSTRRRVKLYELNEDSQWVDKGTGQCSCVYSETKADLCITVRCEETGILLLETKLDKKNIYTKQQDTLIVWTEMDGRDLALSFQESAGCEEVLSQILDTQQRLPGSDDDISAEDDSFVDLMHSDSNDSLTKSGSGLLGALSSHGLLFSGSPDRGQLEEIEHRIIDCSKSKMKKERAIGFLLSRNEETGSTYLEELFDLFERCEDLEDVEGMHLLFNIFRTLVMMNETILFDYLFEEEPFKKLMGVMEYDPELASNRPKHREYISSDKLFKQVVPIQNKKILEKIHQTFRIQYLREVVLPRVLDDNTFQTLSSMIFYNQVEIANHLHADKAFLDELFKCLNHSNPSTQRDTILFIQEFCVLAKNLQVTQRISFFRSLSQHGLFNIFGTILAEADIKTRLAATDILASFLDQDPSLIRSFILSQYRQQVKLATERATAAAQADMLKESEAASAASSSSSSHSGNGNDSANGYALVPGLGAAALSSSSSSSSSSSYLSLSLASLSSASIEQPPPPPPTLVEVLISRLIADPDVGMKAQIAECLRVLLDTSGSSDSSDSNGIVPVGDPDGDEFLNLFFQHYVSRLLEPIPLLWTGKRDNGSHEETHRRLSDVARREPVASPMLSSSGLTTIPMSPSRPPILTSLKSTISTHVFNGGLLSGTMTQKVDLDVPSAALYNHLLELLCFCVKQHTYRINFLILTNDVVVRVMSLVRCRDKFLALAAIRFLRSFIAVKFNEFAHRYVIKYNLIEPVVAVFVSNGSRNNLINSACIEFFDFIRKENIKVLIAHIVENYWEHLKNVTYVDTFTLLHRKYEQSNEGKLNGPSHTSGDEKKKPVKGAWSMEDEDEDAYFSEESNEHGNRSSSDNETVSRSFGFMLSTTSGNSSIDESRNQIDMSQTQAVPLDTQAAHTRDDNDEEKDDDLPSVLTSRSKSFSGEDDDDDEYEDIDNDATDKDAQHSRKQSRTAFNGSPHPRSMFSFSLSSKGAGRMGGSSSSSSSPSSSSPSKDRKIIFKTSLTGNKNAMNNTSNSNNLTISTSFSKFAGSAKSGSPSQSPSLTSGKLVDYPDDDDDDDDEVEEKDDDAPEKQTNSISSESFTENNTLNEAAVMATTVASSISSTSALTSTTALKSTGVSSIELSVPVPEASDFSLTPEVPAPPPPPPPPPPLSSVQASTKVLSPSTSSLESESSTAFVSVSLSSGADESQDDTLGDMDSSKITTTRKSRHQLHKDDESVENHDEVLQSPSKRLKTSDS